MLGQHSHREFGDTVSKSCSMRYSRVAEAGMSIDYIADYPHEEKHYVYSNAISELESDVYERALFGMGDFHGAEKLFWLQSHVYFTAVGYAAISRLEDISDDFASKNDSCVEVVLVVFDNSKTSYFDLLTVFWENHDPTRELGSITGRKSKFRSILCPTSVSQRELAMLTLRNYQNRLNQCDYGCINTEIVESVSIKFADKRHQQYLAKNPRGYSCKYSTGIRYSAE